MGKFQAVLEQINAYTTRQNAAIEKVTYWHEKDGTFCRLVENRKTGKFYVLQGQLCRDYLTGRFVRLSDVLA